jgi:hypothetical protein
MKQHSVNDFNLGELSKDIEELFGEVDLEKVLKDEIVAEIKEQHDKHLLNTLMSGTPFELAQGCSKCPCDSL